MDANGAKGTQGILLGVFVIGFMGLGCEPGEVGQVAEGDHPAQAGGAVEKGGWFWRKRDRTATDVGANATGWAWVIGTDVEPGGYGIYKMVGGDDWKKVPGGAVRIAVDPRGNAWIVNDQGRILRWTGKDWSLLSGLAHDIAVGDQGDVWVIGRDPVPGGYGIWVYNEWDNDWAQIPGGGVRIAVAQLHQPVVINDQGAIVRRTPSGDWERLPGVGKDIGANSRKIWLVDAHDAVYSWSGPIAGQETIVPRGKWVFENAAASAISAGRKDWDNPFIVGEGNVLFSLIGF